MIFLYQDINIDCKLTPYNKILVKKDVIEENKTIPLTLHLTSK